MAGALKKASMLPERLTARVRFRYCNTNLDSSRADGLPKIIVCLEGHKLPSEFEIQSQTPQHTPQSAICTGLEHLPESEPTPSIFFTTSMPPVTLPKTTCFPSH